MSELKVFPLLWRTKEGKDEEANPEVHRLARFFAEKNLVEVPKFENFMRTWLLLECDRDALVEPWGILALRMAVDCPLFHMKTPENQERLTLAKFGKGYHMLARRAREYLQDQGWAGQQVFVHVEENETAALMVRRLYNELGLKESNRLSLEI
jgi:hypothetical protein